MRVLDIGPGITRCGVEVVDTDVSRMASLVYVAVIRSEPDLATRFRLLKISEGIAATITRLSLETVALERPFAKENRQSVTTIMQAMGVAMAEAGWADLPVALRTPSETKAAVSGNGAAMKAQVGAMIARISRLDKPPKSADVADVLAVAIIYAWGGTGILGSGIDGDVSVSLLGGVKTRVGTKLTAVRQTWAQAETQSRRSRTVRRHSR